MAASPVTGERPAGFRRSSSQFASIPQRSLSFHEKVGLAKDDAAADVLYTHPSVRIYSFQPPTDALSSLDKTKKTLPDADYPIDAIEILPWRARTETLAARGKLIIEKVQGSVHFLKAGELIHTIMKNSQCWCVDGESKFVMRVGRLRYQRIEMPTAEPEDKEKVEEFKEVISKILKFEKTPCPFIRAFQVDLPEDAITPRRRGTWKRKESLPAVTPEDESRSIRRTKTSRTMSMRGMPPSAFPSRSLTQLDMERPRTASTPISTGRFSFPDVRAESPIHYTSGEDNTDSDRHDSESDRPGTGHSSEFEESDRESTRVPLIRSPLKNVQTLNAVPNENAPSVLELAKRAEAASLAGNSQTTGGATMSPSKSEMTPLGSPSTVTPVPIPREGGSGPSTEASSGALPLTSTGERSPSKNLNIFQALEHDRRSVTEETELQILGESFVPGMKVDEDLKIPSTGQEPDASTQGGEAPLRLSSTPSEAIYIDKSVSESTVDAISAATNTEQVLPESGEQVLEPEGVKTSDTALLKESEVDLSVKQSAPCKTDDDAESITSFDSFRTVPSDDEDTALHPMLLGTRPFQHRRELSEMTVVALPSQEDDQQRSTQVDGTTELIQNIEEADQTEHKHAWQGTCTPGAFTEDPEIRQRLKHRRSLSPLPPASILQTSNQMEQHSPLPAALLQKAATLAVVKPLEVLVFVVQVLARIAGGATMNDLVSGDLFRRPGVRRTASGTFEQAVRGRQTNRESDEEDDYGVPVHGRRKSSNKEEKPGFMHDRDVDDAASFASID